MSIKFAPDPRNFPSSRSYEFIEEGVVSSGYLVAKWKVVEELLERRPDKEDLRFSLPGLNFYGKAMFVRIPTSEIKKYLASRR
jgi:hypothetical protein